MNAASGSGGQNARATPSNEGPADERCRDAAPEPKRELAFSGAITLRQKNTPEKGLHGLAASGEQYPSVANGHDERDEEGTAVSRVAPGTRSFTCSPGVSPCVSGRWSMPLVSAQRIRDDEHNPFHEEAMAVIAAGKAVWVRI